MNHLQKLQNRIIEEKTKRNVTLETISNLENKLDIANKRHDDSKEARILLQLVAKQTQSSLEYHISSLVTSALESVFDEPYEFKVRFTERRNKTECDLLFIKDGEEIGRPIESSGGGAIDVAALALRIAFWSLNKNRPVLILDEPTKYVSVEYQEQVSQMLKMLSDKLGIQFIIITHQKPMAEYADKVFTIKQGELVNA